LGLYAGVIVANETGN